MDTRKRLSAILAQVRCDIDAAVRKLHHLANEAEGIGLNATAAIADDAAEAAEEFAAAFAAAYKPSGEVIPASIQPQVIPAIVQPPQVIPAKQSFSIAALLGLR